MQNCTCSSLHVDPPYASLHVGRTIHLRPTRVCRQPKIYLVSALLPSCLSAINALDPCACAWAPKIKETNASSGGFNFRVRPISEAQGSAQSASLRTPAMSPWHRRLASLLFASSLTFWHRRTRGRGGSQEKT